MDCDFIFLKNCIHIRARVFFFFVVMTIVQKAKGKTGVYREFFIPHPYWPADSQGDGSTVHLP